MKNKLILTTTIICTLLSTSAFAAVGNETVTSTHYGITNPGTAIPREDIYLYTDLGVNPSFYWCNEYGGPSDNIDVSWSSSVNGLINYAQAYNGLIMYSTGSLSSGTANVRIDWTDDGSGGESWYSSEFGLVFNQNTKGTITITEQHFGSVGTYSTTIHLIRSNEPITSITLPINTIDLYR